MITRMELVLLSNALWIIFLSGWCVFYFVQAKVVVGGVVTMMVV